VTRLGEVAQHGRTEIARAEAARALWLIEEAGDPEAADALIQALEDPSVPVRERAAQALSLHWRARPKEALAGLLAVAADESFLVRIHVYHTLPAAFRHPETTHLTNRVLQSLRSALNHEAHPLARTALFESLPEFGSDASATIPELARLLQSEDIEVAAGSVQALLRLGVRSESVVSRVIALVELGAWPDLEAARMLVDCGPRGWEDAANRCTSVAASRAHPSPVRREALQLLVVAGLANPGRTADFLRSLMNDDDEEVVAQAEVALAGLQATLAALPDGQGN
jgi:HEAT repeat protein